MQPEFVGNFIGSDEELHESNWVFVAVKIAEIVQPVLFR